MPLVLIALAIIGVGAVVAVATARVPDRAARITAGFVIAGCLSGAVAAARVLSSGNEFTYYAAWSVPLASFSIGIDSLAAVFLLGLFGVSALAAVFGAGYMHGANARQAAVGWSMYALLVGAMALVVLARNGVLFLLAWELMALSSFFLVTLNDASVEVRNAGKTYLIASHIGTAFLLAFFLIAGQASQTLDFSELGAAGRTAGMSGALFVLALIGFGTKAGLMPMHVWLPEAHPAAPSHVSALMSAVLIKTGIYGLLRALQLIGAPESWWGWSLIGLGLTSAALGALLALVQHDLKRLLAYSTVENAGLIAMGIGIGVLGQLYGSPVMAALGYGGAIMHVMNHTVFKGLLFLGAGVIDRATETRNLNRLGGLMKWMPVTGTAFLIGSMAAAGVPPLNGFIGEFLLFRAGTGGGTSNNAGDVVLGALTAVGIGVTGALAAGAYLKAFGTAFTGAPRTPAAARVRETRAAMWLPLVVLAVLAVAAAFSAPLLLDVAGDAASVVTGSDSAAVKATLQDATGGLKSVIAVFAVLAAAGAGLALLRLWLLSGRTVTKAVTWDCGYARPGAHMQYTGSSFVQPLAVLFQAVLRSKFNITRPEGLFPRRV